MKSIVLLIIITFSINAQSIRKEGNLVRIDFREDQFCLCDTTANWFYSSNPTNFHLLEYIGAITRFSQNHFVYRELFQYDDGILYEGWMNYGLMNSESFEKSGLFSLPFFLYFPTYYSVVNFSIVDIDHGAWFLTGNRGNNFMDTTGYITNVIPELSGFVFICGQIDSLYLVVFYKNLDFSQYDFKLADLSGSPEIDTTNAVDISIIPKAYPLHISKVTENIYLMDDAESESLGLYLKEENNLIRIKKIFEDLWLYGREPWKYYDGFLFINSDGVLKRFEYNSADTSFINETILHPINDNTVISYDWKYSAKIIGDSLFVINTKLNQIVNGYNISNINSPSRPVIDSPYVYIHQLKKVTDVKENDEAIVNEYSLSSYPNPFNAVTTITYSVPEAEQVEIKIYDVLGREVTTLKNEIEEAGKHKINWDANKSSSGIYICTMRTKQNILSIKLLLIK
ncbi:MAG: T9SS type A sorting domain-containing protein [Melioribacteraceae bacterium]|nr:T9SS type A sorting domain-containing protein [Melioribacteraceae bacterium]MCF8354098.1 T9SS type A sorting domain-containing protein [Melioribacteraceae bacterium]MCF8393770.1 T9SS type A sorting domain-containing protein [Melioribacteraceae bacterium]MCF8419514.1 T9SS type A sorting domain-containing protein [Melioribacteraceae bacterium]